jgi:hypothetical protein
MSTSAKLLPTELAALVHHVELNRSGWWDKAVHRLVLAAVWLSETPPTIPEIQGVHLILELAVGRKNFVKGLWPFRQVSRFRGWLWTLVILTFALSVGASLAANRIQKNLDNQETPLATAPVSAPPK